jgi:hypothetical protein
MRAASAVIASLALLACTAAQDRLADPGSDIALLEAVYRHQMANNASSQSRGSPLYCLARDGRERRDPPPALLARFVSGAPKVLPFSACRIDQRSSLVTDPVTHATGLILSISDIRCRSAYYCKVAGGYYEANQSASGNTYTVEKKAGRWLVTDDRLDMIS